MDDLVGTVEFCSGVFCNEVFCNETLRRGDVQNISE